MAKQAEPILEKYLKLRYQLMPYIYSLGYHDYQTGAPFMRALLMDFPDDPKVSDLRRRVYVRAGVSGGSGDGAGRDQPQGVSAGGRGLVQLLDERAASRAGRRSPSMRRSIRCRSLCARAR